MTHNHLFIFSPSNWLREGKIRLNMVDEDLGFFTRWNVAQNEAGRIECVQKIQVKGLSDIMLNQFSFFNMASGNFNIELENQALGKISGTGLITDKIIAWEFRIADIGFEGFEFYEKENETTYLMRAEYATRDQFRTLITGKVWKPENQKDTK
jgi:hypothetical protein